MQFTIYTLGDVKLYEGALNGIAMMYTVASGHNIDLWTSNMPMGLGIGALLGALMALIIMIFTGYQKRELDIRSVLLPLFLYFGLTVPKATVVIQDAYSQQAPVHVDNVPVGLAMPLGAISSIAMTATRQLETVFYIPYGGFTKITDEGYVAPLKLLHAIRYTGMSAKAGIPNLTETLKQISHICLVNNPAFDSKSYRNEIDGFSVFLTALKSPDVANRVVIVPTSGAVTRQVLSCEKAGEYVSSALDAYLAGVNSNSALQMISDAELKKRNFQVDVRLSLDQQNNASVSNGVDFSTNGQIVASIGALAGANNAEVVQFLKSGLLDDSISTINHCTATKLKSDKAKCQNYITAVEQWKEKSSADASGFVSIMRDGQNLLIILSIILFPIMILIVIIKGVSSFKIFGSYLLFTICSFMWLPVASLLNYYTHLQLHEELLRFNPTQDPKAFLSLKNAPAFYDAVSQKLALANSALASTPMICMGLFSGMLMTINGLTDKWNTQSKFYDAKSAIPDAIKRSPISTVSSSVNYANINAKPEVAGLAQAQNTSKNFEMAQTLKKQEGLSKSKSMILGRMLEDKTTRNLSFEEKWSVAQKAVERFSNEHLDQKTKDQVTSVVFSKMFKGADESGQNYTELKNKDGSTSVVIKNGQTFRLEGKLGYTFGEKGDNPSGDPDKENQSNSQSKSGGANKLINKILKKSAIGGSYDQGIYASANLVDQDTKTVGDTLKKQGSIASEEKAQASHKTGHNSVGNTTDRFSSKFEDILASELGKVASTKDSNSQSNAVSKEWQSQMSNYDRASKELTSTNAYIVEQTRTAPQLANQLNWSPQMKQRISENVQNANLENNPTYQANVNGVMAQLNSSSLIHMSDQGKMLLAQHTALKMMGGETAVSAIRAEYGNYELETAKDDFLKDRKVGEAVDRVLKTTDVQGKVEKAKQLAPNSVDIEPIKSQAIALQGEFDKGAQQGTKAYTLEKTSIDQAKKEHQDRENKMAIDKMTLANQTPDVVKFEGRDPTSWENLNTTAGQLKIGQFKKVDNALEKLDENLKEGNPVGVVFRGIEVGGRMVGAGVLDLFEGATPVAPSGKAVNARGEELYTISAVDAGVEASENKQKTKVAITTAEQLLEERASKLQATKDALEKAKKTNE